MYLMPLICTLKKINMVNYMLCSFHDKEVGGNPVWRQSLCIFFLYVTTGLCKMIMKKDIPQLVTSSTVSHTIKHIPFTQSRSTTK